MSRSVVATDSRGAWRRAPLVLGQLVATLVLGACVGAGAAPTPSAATATLAPATPSAAMPTDTPADSTLPPPIDPCSLISQSEANALAGAPLGAGIASGNPVPTECMWTAPPTASVGQVQIDVGDGAKKSYDIDHDALKHDFTTVPGLGDEAYAESDAIFFRSGTTWVAIHLVLLNDPAQNAARLVTLAKLVAGRI